MAKNRTMEAKRIKYIRQSKARPRTLRMNNGYQKVSQVVDRDRIPKDARSLFEYRQRAKISGDAYKEAFLTSILDTLYPNFSKPIVKEREVEALRLKVNTMEPVDRKLLILNGRFIKLALLSNRDMDCVEFMEYQVLPGIIRRSITYSSYNRAMQVQQFGTIRWKEVIHIPNVEFAPLEVDT